jgi:hypothetical protein
MGLSFSMGKTHHWGWWFLKFDALFVANFQENQSCWLLNLIRYIRMLVIERHLHLVWVWLSLTSTTTMMLHTARMKGRSLGGILRLLWPWYNHGFILVLKRNSFNMLFSYTYSCMEGPCKNMNPYENCFCYWRSKTCHWNIGLIIMVGRLQKPCMMFSS